MNVIPSNPCNLCGDRAARVVGHRDRDGRPLRSVLCGGCGLVWSDPRPADDALDAWYAEDYRREYKGVVTPRLRHVVRAGRVALDRFERVRPLLSDRPALLDVGAGAGEFLYVASRLSGIAARGLEPNAGYAAHAREVLGLDVTRGFVQSHAFTTGEFDVITMFHVLEHLADPQGALRRIAGWLRPGGHLVVEVPDVEATCQSPAHTFHKAHLYTFGVATLERMGACAGLRPVVTRRSPDGGNVEVVFLRRPGAVATVDPRIPGNADRVAGVLAGHRALGHAARGRPLVRLGRRLASQCAERWAATRVDGSRAALDAIVARYAATHRHLVLSPATG